MAATSQEVTASVESPADRAVDLSSLLDAFDRGTAGRDGAAGGTQAATDGGKRR